MDFPEIDTFLSSLKEGLKEEIPKETFSEITKTQSSAWLSPDFSTRVSTLRGKLGGFDAEIEILFRLRTLCVEVRCWKTSKNGMSLFQAFKDMKKFEEEFEDFIGKWVKTEPSCNILVLKPFYKATSEAQIWLSNNLRNIKFLPTNCDNKCTFTFSQSKLMEKKKSFPFW